MMIYHMKMPRYISKLLARDYINCYLLLLLIYSCLINIINLSVIQCTITINVEIKGHKQAWHWKQSYGLVGRGGGELHRAPKESPWIFVFGNHLIQMVSCK